MNKNLDDLKDALFTAKDGGAACDAINTLAKHAEKGNRQAKQVLALYIKEGRINHMRKHACFCLAESVKQPDGEFTELFREGLFDSDLRYWSILGYINSGGKDAYKELAKIAIDKTIPLGERAHAIKSLAMFSRQPFDRHLPSDPGHWKETDLRISEIEAWAKGAYPDGQGYSPPSRHAALDKPKTAFEKTVSRFDKKLAKKRKKRQDLADPNDWLTVATPEDIKRIKARWKLPFVYLDFLTRFSPVKVTVKSRRFYNHFQLFGAGELIEAQEGYSFNPVEHRPIEDWPAHLLVIASHGGDPFVLDLSKSDGNDAPVETAEHGMGVWEFSRVADSFSEFLATLAKQL
jgi:SMI1 / KNR4 family (SUKH-1)